MPTVEVHPPDIRTRTIVKFTEEEVFEALVAYAASKGTELPTVWLQRFIWYPSGAVPGSSVAVGFDHA